MGQLPASTIGLGRSDSELAHRTGSLGRPPHDVLLPPPRVPAPANPLRNGIQSLRRGIKRVVGKVSSKITLFFYKSKVKIKKTSL